MVSSSRTTDEHVRGQCVTEGLPPTDGQIPWGLKPPLGARAVEDCAGPEQHRSPVYICASHYVCPGEKDSVFS